MTAPSIIVVEDDPALRTLTARALQENGYHVRTCSAAPEMWLALEQGPVDLILLDIMLPGTSGIDLCRQIRQNSSVPIIFVSAKGSEVDRVIGNAEKMRAETFQALGAGEGARMVVNDIMSVRETAHALVDGFGSRARAYVQIQNGCDHRCTFCIIPFGRGPSRSVPAGEVVAGVRRLVEAGYAEVVLTGVDITDYEGGLGLLCQRLLRDLPSLKRLRLSSLDSIEIDDALMELIAGDPRLMPHFHLSLQAGDDLVLKRMKRRHSRAQSVETVAAIKSARPDATIGADLIAGFPTESEEAAVNTLRLLDDCDIVAAHVFPFSPRPNTPAARMPQLERELVKARASRLREAAARRRSTWLAGLVGTTQKVLVENSARGHTDGFAPVFIAGSRRGDTGLAEITGTKDDSLVGVFA